MHAQTIVASTVGASFMAALCMALLQIPASDAAGAALVAVGALASAEAVWAVMLPGAMAVRARIHAGTRQPG